MEALPLAAVTRLLHWPIYQCWGKAALSLLGRFSSLGLEVGSGALRATLSALRAMGPRTIVDT